MMTVALYVAQVEAQLRIREQRQVELDWARSARLLSPAGEAVRQPKRPQWRPPALDWLMTSLGHSAA